MIAVCLQLQLALIYEIMLVVGEFPLMSTWTDLPGL